MPGGTATYTPVPAPPGGGAGDVSDLDQEDWDTQTGDVWDRFTVDYLDGWDTGCQDLFDESPDGNRYENGDEYDVTDCQGLGPADASDLADLPARVPFDPESDGEHLGEQDGCQALSSRSRV